MPTNSDKQTIYIWPDDTWMYAENYEDIEQTHKSDDFATIEISAELDDEEIEELVYNYNRK